MERILAALILCAVVPAAWNQITCKSENFVKLKAFNKQVINMEFPCGYTALKGQKCGKYKVSLHPFNEWVGQEYRLDGFWLSITEVADVSKVWYGRTTNKLAVKYLNAGGKGRELFNTKGGTVKASDIFVTKIGSDDCAHIEEIDGLFLFIFCPWHPRGKAIMMNNPNANSYPHSRFQFTCSLNEPMKPFPEQMCGNLTKNVIEDKAKIEFKFKGTSMDLRHRMVLYYEFFMDEDNHDKKEGRCFDASNTLRNVCQTRERALTVLKNCEPILAGGTHTKCVASYSCHPMDIFNACLRWGCAGETPFGTEAQDDCRLTGAGIDLCPNFATLLGNLTGHLRSAKCYNEYVMMGSS